MEIGSDAWIELILDGGARLDVSIDERHAHLFARHAGLLMEWNRKLNLTAIVDPTQVAVKHFLDAIAPLAHIPSHGHILDIGTGGGFPGIPLKIMRPGQPMTLIDSVRKKVSFVKQAIRTLALSDIAAHHVRAENMGAAGNRPQFEVIVCRALSNLDQVVQWAGPLLADKGTIVAYHGPGQGRAVNGQDEPATLNFQNQTYAAECHAYDLPILGDRRIVTLLKAVV